MGAFLSHIDQILLMAYGGLLLRGIAFVPCAWTVLGGKLLFPGDGALLSLLLWLTAVMPLRNYGYTRLRQFADRPVEGALTYAACFRNGAYRVGRGMAYGLLFYFLTGTFYYGYHYVDFKTYYSFLKSLGALLGGKADLGLVLWAVCIAAALLLFVFLWKRDQHLDFWDITVPSSARGPRRPLRGTALLKNCARDLALLLPSAALWAWILWTHYAGGLDLENGAMAALRSFSTQIRRPIPGTVLLKMGLVLILVHVPLAVLRKTGDALDHFRAEKQPDPAPGKGK